MKHRSFLFLLLFTPLIVCQEQQPKIENLGTFYSFCTAPENKNIFQEIKTQLGIQSSNLDYRKWSLFTDLLSRIPIHKTQENKICTNASSSQIYNPRHRAWIYLDKNALHFKFTDKTVIIKDVREKPVNALLNISNNLCATGSKDGSVKIWDISTQCETARFINPDKKDSSITRLAFMKPNILFSLAHNRIGANYHITGWNIYSGDQLFSIQPTYEHPSNPSFYFNVNVMCTEGTTLYCSDNDNNTISFDFSKVITCKEKIEEPLDLQDIIILNYLQKFYEEKKQTDNNARPNIAGMYFLAQKNGADKLAKWLGIIRSVIFEKANMIPTATSS